MYVIKMTPDKALVTTVCSEIYQYESNADTLVFLVPKLYEDCDLADCVLLLRYITPDGTGTSEELEMYTKPYSDNYYQYHLNITTSITKFSGEVELWLTAINADNDSVLKSAPTTIKILPSKNITDHFPSENLDQLDELTMKVSLLEKNKADNIIYDNDQRYLQLTAYDRPIGDKVGVGSIDIGADNKTIDFDSPEI